MPQSGLSRRCWIIVAEPLAVTHNRSSPRICIIPRVGGLGGPGSFRARLTSGLAGRGIQVTDDLNDPTCAAVLILGASSRQIGGIGRARRRGARIVQRLNGMNWIHRLPPAIRRTQDVNLRYRVRAELNNLLLAGTRRWLADHIIYQSQFSQNWWMRVWGATGASASVVYNGIDLSQYTPDGPHQRPQDCFRVQLVEARLGSGNTAGLENAIHLVTRLQDRMDRPVELRVIGDVPEALRAMWNPPDRIAVPPIRWAGVLKGSQIAEADRSAHLLFSGDINAACPNSVVEALACGLPVAALDTGALAEMVQHGAGAVVPYGSDYWKLEPPNLAPLVDAAAQILTGNEPYRLAARAHAANTFGLEQMTDGYLSHLLG